MKTIKYPAMFTALALGLSTAAWAAGGSATDTRSSQTGASTSGQTAQAGQSGSQMGSGSQGSSSTMGATSGGMSSSWTASEAEARQLLQAEGYSNITGLEAQSGGMFQAKADKNGQPVNVTVDITSKKVTEQ